MYTLMMRHTGIQDETFTSFAAAKKRARELLPSSRVYLAESFWDDQGREVWEVYDRPASNFPDGDPYAYYIQREKRRR